MFANTLSARRRRSRRAADRAWHQLAAAAGSAGDTARLAHRRTSHLAAHAGHRMGPMTDEARHRTMAALDALSGRRPRTPWAWIAGAAATGVALGWLAAAMARSAMTPGADAGRSNGRVELVDVNEPTSTVRR
ncbi:hypothetical protein ACN27F_28410 [Solwaraspora sp. WMMB335]|uniref:hypothetical protein n=1 Tax=Solwaraspora sp. WMMB335 TaxID=3404118 RepID=UPI003B95D9F1